MRTLLVIFNVIIGSMDVLPTNTSPNPECPFNESYGIYPNCTCDHKNFDYSVSLNVCFRVCPENSNGYWPKCFCDFGGHFNKKRFKCITCPEDSTGQYPDCNCNDNGAAYNKHHNYCEKCENGSAGNFPHCFCSDGSTYDGYHQLCVPGCVWANGGYGCLQCPTYNGHYPNCTCVDNGVYVQLDNTCIDCPIDSDGVYPNCVCQDHNSTYITTSNECYSCPSNSTGEYPNCVCESPLQYIQSDNSCVGCPGSSTGTYPHCKCDNGYISETLMSCIKCPTDAIGLYPECKYRDANLTFSAHINSCYLECPGNSSGIQPDCQCDGQYDYDATEVACKSRIGRMCPADSIGIGPDCLCMNEDFTFHTSTWICELPSVDYSGYTIDTCEGEGRWPQCADSIDRCVLLSCIG